MRNGKFIAFARFANSRLGQTGMSVLPRIDPVNSHPYHQTRAAGYLSKASA
jgi:hypothetical protein